MIKETQKPIKLKINAKTKKKPKWAIVNPPTPLTNKTIKYDFFCNLEYRTVNLAKLSLTKLILLLIY